MLELLVFILASLAMYPFFKQNNLRKDNQMETRFFKPNLLSLSEVETEIDTMLSIVGDSDLDTKTEQYILGLMQVARALGSTRNW